MTADAMLLAKPGVFCAGEMLDWDAPTGGYLLTACLATGRWAGLAVARYLGDQTFCANRQRRVYRVRIVGFSAPLVSRPGLRWTHHRNIPGL